MADSATDRSILESQLASFLGFDDVSDLLDHLTSIECPSDLSEYLSQLLGDTTAGALREFVADIGRYKGGERISNPIAKTAGARLVARENDYSAGTTSKKGASVKAGTSRNISKGKKVKGRGNGNGMGAKLDGGTKKVPPPVVENPQPPIISREADKYHDPKKKDDSRVEQVEVSHDKKQTRFDKSVAVDSTTVTMDRKLPPKKGKAAFVCGCFGTRHGSLANCLHCGRISCEREGYGYCPFCENLIEKVEIDMKNGNSKLISAQLHKARLLQFDQEFVSRTKVYDDQEDYFSSATSKWLTEDEKDCAKESDEKKRRDLHVRKTQLKLSFD